MFLKGVILLITYQLFSDAVVVTEIGIASYVHLAELPDLFWHTTDEHGR